MTYLDLYSANHLNLADVQACLQTELMADFEVLFRHLDLPSPLAEAVHYALANGGKRVRPLLVLSVFLTLGGQQHFDQVRRAMMAVEMIHGYSLIHDDLPCMDDDDLRRGLPTCHIKFGEAVALLAGDVLQASAFEVLTVPLDGLLLDLGVSAKLAQQLSSGARRMVAGQMLDLNGEDVALEQSALECIHRDKTGALIEAAVLMGGICASVSDEIVVKLRRYAWLVGLAFQVQDDVLDVVADTKTLGKPVGSDEKLEKSTYVKLLGVDGAGAYAKELFIQAREQVADLGYNNLLLQMVDWLEKRRY